MHNSIQKSTIEKNVRLYKYIIDELTSRGILAYIRTASTGNIHIIVHGKEGQHSVVRFAHSKIFRIFYPYPSHNKQQTKIDRKEWTDVVTYFIARQ